MNFEIEDQYGEYYKVIVVGNSGTGKTNIIQTYNKGIRPSHTLPTVGVDYCSKNVQVSPTHRVKLQIWDTAGQEQFRSITKGHYQNALGALVVFDVTKKHSFDAVPSWIYDIRERSDENVVIGIIGNKVDLERVVSKQEGQTLADHSQAFYMETTIHDLNSLKDAFTRLAQQISRTKKNNSLEFSKANVPLKGNNDSGPDNSCLC